MLRETDIAYLAGLFDGEGCVQYKQYIETKKKHKGPGTRKTKVWRITIEISMSDESTIRLVHKLLGVGTVIVLDKTKPPHGKPHYLKQWRWKCSHRDAFWVATLFWPYAHTKLVKINDIIQHYAGEQFAGEQFVDSKPNIINLKEYRDAYMERKAQI